MAEAGWYVVHTYSGYENKVKANIEKTIENRHLEDQILEVRVPVQDVVEMKTETKTVVKDGVEQEFKTKVKKVVKRKLFPSYVLLNMVMNDDTWYVVRNTRGVTGFVGPGSKPVPLTEQEMFNMGIQEESVILGFSEGDTVLVTSGIYKDQIGVVQKVNLSKEVVTINVEMFGRETPLEIGFEEIKRVSKESQLEAPSDSEFM